MNLNNGCDFYHRLDCNRPNNTECRLYHYTSAGGFLGIFNGLPGQAPELWASEIHYMNDASEFHHGAEIIREQAEILLKNEIGPVKNIFLGFLSNFINTLDYPVFITSFCENDDLLSQWRGYGGDMGYSIGWDFEELRNIAKEKGWFLVQCIYDEGEQKQEAQSYLKFIIDLLDKSLKSNTLDYEFYYCVLGSFLSRFIPMLKHESFSEEKEWRLISPWPINANGINIKDLTDPILQQSAIGAAMQKQGVCYRQGRSGIIPYVKFSLNDQLGRFITPISIRSSPNSLSGLSTGALKMFMKTNGLPDSCSIYTSGAPFRI